MSSDTEPASFDLVVAGRKLDNRTVEARRFRVIASDLLMQLRRNPTAADRLLITNAATLAMLCEQATADMIEGKPCDQENYRRNVTLLGSTLIKLGMAMKSRDVARQG